MTTPEVVHRPLNQIMDDIKKSAADIIAAKSRQERLINELAALNAATTAELEKLS